jgi:hypothetical protein
VDYIIQKWPQLTIALLYLVIFFRVLVLNLFAVFAYMGIALLVLLAAIIPPLAFIRLLPDTRKVMIQHANKTGNFLGDLTNNIHKDLFDNVPFFFPRNTIVVPLEKFILKTFCDIFDKVNSFFSALGNGILKKCSESVNVNVNTDTAKKSNIFITIFAYLILLLIAILFFLCTGILCIAISFPIVAFVFILINAELLH